MANPLSSIGSESQFTINLKKTQKIVPATESKDRFNKNKKLKNISRESPIMVKRESVVALNDNFKPFGEIDMNKISNVSIREK